ncbi:glycoside hydrolase family 105 protein [Moniliophthora roreri]|nr:glycoside hydrolase family 105 protein [Moniliophthora roreri]
MAPLAPAMHFVTTSLAVLSTLQSGFRNSTIINVRRNLLQVANASWERGTATEALLELDWPALTVFRNTSIPPPAKLNATSQPTAVLKIVNETLATKKTNSLALVDSDGSSADPASLGVAFLLANWTRTNPSYTAYGDAVGKQLDYLLNHVSRSGQSHPKFIPADGCSNTIAASGAISHRADETQLWADFVYMVPPFIAYYGALQGKNGTNLLQTAYTQCSLYRDALRDSNGLWRHVALGSWQDTTHWATGNAWAAAGMFRVLQTIEHSSVAKNFASHRSNLTDWVQEIISSAWKHQTKDGALLNVIDNSTSFIDTSATALLASVTYRMAMYTNDTTHITNADRALALVQDNVDESGWLQQTVDPYIFSTPSKSGSHSPEGQAFVLMLHAAWRDYADTSRRTRLQ